MMVIAIRRQCYCSEFSTLQGALERCCINNTMHPETKMTRQTARNNDAALAAFVAKKAEIDAMLVRLQVLSDDHFGPDPERVNWADVGSLEHQASLLKQISDFALGESEHRA